MWGPMECPMGLNREGARVGIRGDLRLGGNGGPFARDRFKNQGFPKRFKSKGHGVKEGAPQKKRGAGGLSSGNGAKES